MIAAEFELRIECFREESGFRLGIDRELRLSRRLRHELVAFEGARGDEQFDEAALAGGDAREAAPRRQRSGGGADGAEELVRRRILQDVGHGPTREGEVAESRVHGQEDDAGVGELGRERARHVQTRHAGHGVVEDDEIRLELTREAQRGRAVDRFADDVDTGLEREHRADALAYGEVIVRDQDPRCHFGGCSLIRAPSGRGRGAISRLVSPPLRHR